MGIKSIIVISLIIVALIIIIPFLLGFFTHSNIINMSPIGFILVITSGIIAFLGYVCGNFDKTGCAKVCFNLSPLVLFFGMVALEVVIFGQFFPKSQVSATSCSNSESNAVNIASCILTGYKVSGGYSTWTWASFWVFYIILPFVFVFAFLFGLLYPFTGMFGGGMVGKSVTSVLSFVIAAYATRQIFGAYLLDLFAYGVWGLVGIFIPLFLSFGLKRLFDMFLKPVEQAKETLWSSIQTQIYPEANEIKKELDNIQNMLAGQLQPTREAIKGMETQLKNIENRISSLEQISKKIPQGATKRQLTMYMNEMKKQLKTLQDVVNKRYGGTSPYIT